MSKTIHANEFSSIKVIIAESPRNNSTFEVEMKNTKTKVSFQFGEKKGRDERDGRYLNNVDPQSSQYRSASPGAYRQITKLTAHTDVWPSDSARVTSNPRATGREYAKSRWVFGRR
jgi:hypothetical protein